MLSLAKEKGKVMQTLDWNKSPRYIEDAIYWNCNAGESGSWLRIRDLNLVKDGEDTYYTPAVPAGRCKVAIRDVYPYEDWMKGYIGTNRNLMEEVAKRERGMKLKDLTRDQLWELWLMFCSAVKQGKGGYVRLGGSEFGGDIVTRVYKAINGE